MAITNRISENELVLPSLFLNYKEQGGLNCACCSFNFSDFYGKEIGDGFIEMHHKKPIFQYQGDDLIKTIQDAISNIVPLCSNCHRMIHRYGKQLLQIESLISQIKSNGRFSEYR
jgi:predicted HNH restriction endonuclease